MSTKNYISYITRVNYEYMEGKAIDVMKNTSDFKDYSIKNVQETYVIETDTYPKEFFEVMGNTTFASEEHVEDELNECDITLLNYEMKHNGALVRDLYELETEKFIGYINIKKFGIKIKADSLKNTTYNYIQNKVSNEDDLNFIPNSDYIIDNVSELEKYLKECTYEILKYKVDSNNNFHKDEDNIYQFENDEDIEYIKNELWDNASKYFNDEYAELNKFKGLVVNKNILSEFETQFCSWIVEEYEITRDKEQEKNIEM